MNIIRAINKNASNKTLFEAFFYMHMHLRRHSKPRPINNHLQGKKLYRLQVKHRRL